MNTSDGGRGWYRGGGDGCGAWCGWCEGGGGGGDDVKVNIWNIDINIWARTG